MCLTLEIKLRTKFRLMPYAFNILWTRHFFFQTCRNKYVFRTFYLMRFVAWKGKERNIENRSNVVSILLVMGHKLYKMNDSFMVIWTAQRFNRTATYIQLIIRVMEV